MATAMTIRTRPNPYDIVPVDVAALDTFDNVNGMTLPADGRTGLLFQNQTGAPITVTITGTLDPLGRAGPITAYSVVAGHFAIFQEFPALGWASGGLITITASGALRYAAIRRADGT